MIWNLSAPDTNEKYSNKQLLIVHHLGSFGAGFP